MVPAVFVRLPAIPLTVNGKVAEHLLPRPDQVGSPIPDGAEPTGPADELAVAVARIWAETVQAGAVSLDDNFFDIGGTSMHVAQVHRRLTTELRADGLSMMELFEFPTPARWPTGCAATPAMPRSGPNTTRTGRTGRPGTVPPPHRRPEPLRPPRARPPDHPKGRHAMSTTNTEGAIAIIGVAGRFPGADTVDDLWRNLVDGVESVRPLTADELLAAGVPDHLRTRPAYVPAAAGTRRRRRVRRRVLRRARPRRG